MATPSLKQRLRIVVLVAVALVGVPVAAYATYPVIDTSAIAKLSDQLTKMQQQISQLKLHTEWLTKLSTQVQDQINAIGKLGKINLPVLNMQKVANQLRKDAQCLKPDLSKLMPGLNPNELEFFNVCDGKWRYHNMLWFDPSKVPSQTDDETGAPVSAEERWRQLAEARTAVQARREEIVKEAASAGMALADLMATKTAEANEKAAGDLENAATAAQDQNTRLAVIAQGTVLQNRLSVQRNQLLAQLVKIQSVMLMQMSGPAALRPTPEKEGGE